jgi:hypothetical protein
MTLRLTLVAAALILRASTVFAQATDTPAQQTPAPSPPTAADAPPPVEAPPPPPPPAEPPPPPPPPTFPNAAPAAAPVYEDRSAPPESEVVPPSAEPPAPLGMFGVGLSFGVAGGGDVLVDARFSDGTDQSLRAGSGVQLGLGLELAPLRSDGHSLSVSLHQSVKYAAITGDNGGFSLVRFPVNVLVHYGYDISYTWGLTLGAGLAYEHGIKFAGEGDFAGSSVELDDALGPAFEGGASYREGLFMARAVLRVTLLEYENKPKSGTLAADSVALLVSGSFFF